MVITSRKLLKTTKIGKYYATTVPGEVRKFPEISEGDEGIIVEERVRGGSDE
ncbi:MAG: hypothetical protein ACP5IE_00690 [Infirmifilum sp.]